MTNWTTRIIVTLIVLMIATVGIGAYLIFKSENTDQKVSIEIKHDGDIHRGQVFEIELKTKNETDAGLNNVEIALSLSEGLISAREKDERRIHTATEQIGDLGVGSVTTKKIDLVGIANSSGTETEVIEVKVTYRTEGGTKFEEYFEEELRVEESPIQFLAKKPDKIISGSAFETEIWYENTSSFNRENIGLELTYPNKFTFINANLSPDSLNNYWDLGEIKSGSKGSLTVKGSIESGARGALELGIAEIIKVSGRNYPIKRATTTFEIAPSPITIEVEVNGVRDYVGREGEILNYIVRYENSSGIPLADAVIKVTPSGEMADLTGSSGTIVWDSKKDGNLGTLEVGERGEVRLATKIKDEFPIKRTSDKNYRVKLMVEIESPSVPSYLSASKTISVLNHETKIMGKTLINAEAFFRDSNIGFTNSGPLPPKVGNKTTYAIRWIITNYATDVENVVVHAKLPGGVKWTGIVESNTNSTPMYDESKREVVWTIATIPATKGIIGTPVRGIFQVEVTPEESNVGKAMTLIEESNLEARDAFTGVALKGNDPALGTVLTDDPTVSQNDGIVIP